MKTLYVSDLDGTLLRDNETISAFTRETIHQLVDEGHCFSYATARSYHTARKATAGLSVPFPLILHNGAMIMNNSDGRLLRKNVFDASIHAVLNDLLVHDVFPIVYAFYEGREQFSYLPHKCTNGMRSFLDSRKGDKRDHPVSDAAKLYQGDIFYITCIDAMEKLKPLYVKYKDSCHCVLQIDRYTNTPWLEIMPKAASKANAIRQLQQDVQCERLIVFGDGMNDMDMFHIADEAYAMANAVPELKQLATAILPSNEEDGVAKWLQEHVIQAKDKERSE